MTSNRGCASDFRPQKERKQESEEAKLEFKELLTDAGFSEKVVAEVLKLYGNSGSSLNQLKKSLNIP